MANPFFSGNINPAPAQNINNANINMFRNVYQAMKNSNNPYQTFLNLAQNNPQMQPIVNALKNGANPQQVFNEMCKQRGINPDEFIKNITG